MSSLPALLKFIKACQLCKHQLEPNPVVTVDREAKVLITGQAPGVSVHRSGIPWNNPGGKALRNWMGIDREQFYSDPTIGIAPMAFCYPGTGTSSDLPPPPICAKTWHEKLFKHMPDLEFILLAGSYAYKSI